MKRSTLSRAALPAALVLSLALAACGGDDDPADTGSGSSDTPAAEDSAAAEDLAGELNGAGASAQQAAMQAWIAGFTEIAPDVVINYDPTGSGGGREQFLGGQTAFVATDAYFDDEELAASTEVCGESGIVEVPNYISPIAVIYNLEGVDQLNLSPTVIAGIFNQQITTWDDPAIAEINPDATLPATAITPVNRSDESGTTENFSDYLVQAAAEAWPYEVSGDWPVPGGESAQGTSGVVDAVGNGDGAIGYADASQAGDLGVAAIQVGEEFVEYTPELAAGLVDAGSPAEGERPEFSFAVDLDRTAEGVYPIALLSYLVGCAEYEDAETADAVRAFFSYIVSEEGQQAAADNAGSAPISEALRSNAEAGIEAIASAG